MKTTSKSKTFQKGDDAIPEILEFVTSNIETDDYTPKGNPLYPEDPRSDLKFKYMVTVTKFYL